MHEEKDYDTGSWKMNLDCARIVVVVSASGTQGCLVQQEAELCKHASGMRFLSMT